MRSHVRKASTLSSADMHYAGATRQHLEDSYKGLTDTFLGVVGGTEIPEFDRFNLEAGTLLMKGWRSIACLLVAQRICSLERARKVFSSSLLDCTWDKLGFDGKLAWAKADAPQAKSLRGLYAK